MRISILDRYIVSAMIPPFLFGIAAFLIFWAFNIFFIASDFIINQHAPVLLVLRFVIYRMPQCTPMAFPFGSLLAGLWAMGQFVGNNEITAMRAAGISVWRIAVGPVVFGIVAAVACYFINETIAPQAVDISTRSFYQIVYHADALPAEQQIFRKDTATDTVYYVTQVMPDNTTLTGVQIFKAARMQPWSETLQAKTATLSNGFMTLRAPVISRYDAKGNVTKQKTGKDVTVPLPSGETAKEFLSSVNSDSWTMSSGRLRQQIDALQSQGIGGTALGVLRVNLANKTAWPFACIVGIFLSVPLAIRYGHRGRFAGIGLSIFALFIYYLMVSAASSFGRTGFIDATLSCWLPNIIISVATFALMWTEEPLISLRPRTVMLRRASRPVEQ